MAQRLILPDFMGNFRHPAVENPDYKTCDISAKWISSFHLFTPRAQKFFNLGQFGMTWTINSHARTLLTRQVFLPVLPTPWPEVVSMPLIPASHGLFADSLKKEHFRICCDAMNVFFAVDDIMDDSDPKTVKKIVAIIMDAFRDWETPRPQGEHIIGEVVRQLSERIAKNASPLTRQRWIDSYEYYLIGNIEESQDKITGTPYNVQSFMAIRERTIGCKPSYNLLEMGLHLPEEILEHPLVQQAHLASTRMVCLANASIPRPFNQTPQPLTSLGHPFVQQGTSYR